MRNRLGQILILILIISTATIGFLVYQNSKVDSGIPKEILKKTAFTVFTIDPSDEIWSLDKSITTYDKSAGVLTLHFTNSSNKITATQQVTPDPFTDIPNYYSILLNKLFVYEEIQTSIGTVALTRPEELKGGQTAIINTSGTLMFYSPDKDLSSAQWKQFFTSLIVIK
jgi:hypothetical protein